MSQGAPVSDEMIAKLRSEGYIPLDEAAAISKVSLPTARRWTEEGKVESTLVFQRYVFVSWASLCKFHGPVACKILGLTK